MAIRYVPDISHFGEATVTGGTVSADRRSAVMQAGGRILLPPGLDMGSGRALASVTEDFSGTGAVITGRSSASPFGQGNVIMDPGTFNATSYDPILGTKPGSQSWVNNGLDVAATVSGGACTFSAATGNTGYYAYTGSVGPNLQAASKRRLTVTHTLKVPSGVGNGWWVAVQFKDPVGVNRNVFFGIASDAYGANTGKPYFGNGMSAYIPGQVSVLGSVVQFALEYDYDDDPTTVRAYFDILSSTTPIPVSQQTFIGNVAAPSGSFLYYWGFISAATATPGGQQCIVYKIGNHMGESEWQPITSGGAPAVNLQYHQLRIDTPNAGTVTAVDIRSDGTAPGAIGVGGVAAVDDNAVGIALTPGANTAAVYAQVQDATTHTAITGAEAAAFVDPDGPVTALGIGNLPAGTYRLEAWGASASGVPTAASAVSANLTLPPVPPSVAVTVSPATIAAGEDATASAVLVGTTATLNGDAWDGSDTVVASGVAAGGTDPPGPVTVRFATFPSRPEVRTVPDEIQIAEITPGTSAVASVRLMTAATLADAPAIDDSQDTNPVAYEDVTFVDGYSTDLPWVRADAWYWVDAIDADGRTTRSAPFWGGAQGDHECALSGTVDEQHIGKYVEVRLAQLVVLGGKEYTVESYRGLVGAGGAWTVTELPREEVWIITFPGSTKPVKRIGSADATTDFSALEAAP